MSARRISIICQILKSSTQNKIINYSNTRISINTIFPKRTLTDVKEEITTAIAIINQLDGKLNYKEAYDAKRLLNPIELTDENIIVSFNKQSENQIIIKAEKTTHTCKDGFIINLDDVTTLKTYSFDDDVSQTICDTRTLTDFNQLYPLLKDMIQNINNWQTKTTIV